MTRKRAVKLLMSVTLDGYRRTANDLMRAYRKKHSAATNEQILLDILNRICVDAFFDGYIEDSTRAAGLFATIKRKGETTAKAVHMEGGITLETKT